MQRKHKNETLDSFIFPVDSDHYRVTVSLKRENFLSCTVCHMADCSAASADPLFGRKKPGQRGKCAPCKQACTCSASAEDRTGLPTSCRRIHSRTFRTDCSANYLSLNRRIHYCTCRADCSTNCFCRDDSFSVD